MHIKKKHIHLVGIGGIGMSGIATILKSQGHTVSGCDQSITQKSIAQLKQRGCLIYHGNNMPECADPTIDTLVYIPSFSKTIPAINAEIETARINNIPCVSRAQMLQELIKTKYSIGVAGSHGKTTTTGLVSHILIHAEVDPTVIIGGHLTTIDSNAYHGSSEFLIAEADESDRSILDLHPTLAIITNIDLEHLETYKNLNDIKQTFIKFIKNIPFYGKAILCLDDENARSLLPFINKKTITYGTTCMADIYASNIKLNATNSTFTVHSKKNKHPLGEITLSIPGNHNVQNALGAIAATLDIGVPFKRIKNALACFGGIERRFSYHGTYQGAELFDDYAHHPREIENTLIIAKKRAKKKLIVVFQPHRYTRTAKLWDDFVQALSNPVIDKLIVTDIYSANEQPLENITSECLVEKIQQSNHNTTAQYLSSDNNFTLVKQEITKSATPGDLIIFLGAGAVYQLADELAK